MREVMSKHTIRRPKNVLDVQPQTVFEVDDSKKSDGTGKTEYEELRDAGAIVDIQDATKEMRMSEREVKQAIREYHDKRERTVSKSAVVPDDKKPPTEKK